MCYLIAKKFEETGCIALKAEHGKTLANFKAKLYKVSNKEVVQLVTISRPSAYGEYEPYVFIDTEEAFEQKVMSM
ncbi:MAG: DUF6718 family protein [Eubacteriales bacterium]